MVVIDRIKEHTGNIALEPIENIQLHSELINDLGLDSLDRVELAMELEKEFSISIPDIDIEEWNDIDDIHASVLKLIG